MSICINDVCMVRAIGGCFDVKRGVFEDARHA